MASSLPPVYSFPPLYTRQPNLLTRRQQISTWIDLICQYCMSQKGWCVNGEGVIVSEKTVDDEQEDAGHGGSIFKNDEIHRNVLPSFVEEIWDEMCQKGKALRIDKGSKTRYYILWKSVDSWASELLQWFENSGKLNQVVTLYELSQGDETNGWEFHGMPEYLLIHCLKPLRDMNRATTLKDEYGAPVAVKVI